MEQHVSHAETFCKNNPQNSQDYGQEFFRLVGQEQFFGYFKNTISITNDPGHDGSASDPPLSPGSSLTTPADLSLARVSAILSGEDPG
jgi:hypothetical protein